MNAIIAINSFPKSQENLAMPYTNISTDMFLHSHKQGMMLMRPDKINNSEFCIRRKYNLKQYLQSPFEVFIMNLDSSIAIANDSVAETCGADSVNDIAGKSPNIFFDKLSADYIMNCDKTVIKHSQHQINEYDMVRNDEVITHHYAVRMPLYDESEKIIGIIGYSAVSDRHSLLDFMNKIIKQPNNVRLKELNTKSSNIYLSNREHQCLKLLIRGKTMREIATYLYISPRTVEHHIVNCKLKFNVTTKSQLVDSALDYFYM